MNAPLAAPVTHWQILSTDPARTASFYGRVFGWQISADNAMGYREVAAAPGGIRGGIWPLPPGAPGGVQLFMTVPDVAACVAAAAAQGAQVIVPVTALPDGDVMAVLLDPLGQAFGLVQAHG
ncbi:VOC family protein [Roseateles sp. NT4]|uniref:VOC family protein n=1 Tax=Roseateles sp. NT4 TaxID=3453715 RepID=UPI003EE8C08E